MTTKRMYLMAIGSQCYDRTGVTFPGQLTIDLTQIFKEISKGVRWEPQFGWSSQPDVLCFDADDFTMRMLEDFAPFLSWLSLMPAEHWMYEMQARQEGSESGNHGE